MKQLLPLLLLLTFYSCNPKPAIDKEALTKELESIYQDDQKYRAEIHSAGEEFGWNSPEVQALLVKQNKIDSSNLLRTLEIIEQVGGYPGKSVVGYPANEATFYVLQHAADSIQEKYYHLIIEAAKNNELNKRLVAMYQDRYLMHKGEPQIYGTQVRMEHKIDAATGARIDSMFLWPIADTTNIDSVRMWNGLGPLEEYLSSFGVSRWK